MMPPFVVFPTNRIAHFCLLYTSEKKALPYEIITSAISGDAQSVNYVLEYYAPYIEELCKRKIKLADGREHDQVDEFMKLRIRAKLIEKIVNFKILLE